MTTYTAIATDDSVNTCDCCGKSNLKSTVVMLSSDGDIFHYGSTCATRNTGKASKVIKAEIDAEQARKVAAARKEMQDSVEEKQYQNKLAAVSKAGVRPGKEFSEAVHAEYVAANAKRIEIAAKYNLSSYSF